MLPLFIIGKIPGFSLFGLTSMLDPLRHANRTGNRELYEWQLLSEHGGLISSSDAIEIMSNATATSQTPTRSG